jgi:ABC-type phosphate/phosphonate transport system ATPase subunit
MEQTTVTHDPHAVPHIQLSGISKAYPNGVQALQNIDLTLYQGEIFGIIGRSGAGNRRCCACLIAWKTPTAAKSPFTVNRHCAIRAVRCATCAAGWR